MEEEEDVGDAGDADLHTELQAILDSLRSESDAEGRRCRRKEMEAEMVTEMAMTLVSPCRARLCLDRLADRGPVRRLHLERGLRLGQLSFP